MNDSNTDSPVIQIPLSKGQFAVVSPEDADLIELKWHLHPNGYASNSKYLKGRKQLTTLMHRVILERILDRELVKDEMADHVDGNRLNNTRSNLRLASPSQNMFNRTVQARNASGYKGVSWQKARNKWHVCIRHNGEKIYLGLFDDVKAAARAYNEAALKYHGEFARLNLIED